LSVFLCGQNIIRFVVYHSTVSSNGVISRTMSIICWRIGSLNRSKPECLLVFC
jgi:hypothetical protein